jgi:hypothetical protein
LEKYPVSSGGQIMAEFVVDWGCRMWGLKSNNENIPASRITFTGF